MSELAIVDEYSDVPDLFNGDKFNVGYRIPGFSEVDKAWLVGVPHVITRVTFWVPQKGIGHCSLEAYVGTAGMLDRAVKRDKIPPTALTADGTPIVEPEEAVVYSDGSTGIRRQIVKLLSSYGLIDVGHEDMPAEGKLGESRFDTPWVITNPKAAKGSTGWKSFSGSRAQGDVQVPSIQEGHKGQPLRILVNGLQPSMYVNDTGDGLTYYLR